MTVDYNYIYTDHSGVLAENCPDGGPIGDTYSIYMRGNTGLFNRKVDDVKQPSREVLISDSRTEYGFFIAHGWCDCDGYAFHDKSEPFVNMGFVDGHVAYHNHEGLYVTSDFSYEWTQ